MEGEVQMSSESTSTLDLSTRLRRSEGRGGRTFAATAKLSKTELSELEQAAKNKQQAVSEWAREVLLREARSTRTDALFTEIVATRMLLNLVLKPLATGTVMKPEEFTGVLATVRTTKHQAATDVMEQYATAGQKER
jgi:hypothetical protein